MLIPFERILALLPENPKRVLHVGAERGSEWETYVQHGLEYLFIEASPFVYEKLIQRVPEQFCINKAVTDTVDEQIQLFQVFSKDRTNLGCSSVLKPTGILDNPYLEQVESVAVETTTLDLLDCEYGPFDMLNMDIQGLELIALKAGRSFLKSPHLKSIILEFNTVSYYAGDCQLHQLDEFLTKYGYERVLTEYASEAHPWGDALYLRSF